MPKQNLSLQYYIPEPPTQFDNNSSKMNRVGLMNGVTAVSPIPLYIREAEEKEIDDEMDEDIDDEMDEEEEGGVGEVDMILGHFHTGMVTVTEEEPEIKSCWICNHCDAISFQLEEFKTHLIKNHKINRDSFTLDAEQNPLIKCITDTIPKDLQPCPECNVSFANLNAMTLHKVRRHGNPKDLANLVPTSDTFPCPDCSGRMGAQDLQLHIKMCHNRDGVVCTICGKILSKACTLNRHVEQVHLNLQIHKPVKCGECGRLFSKKGHLDRHIKTIHMGQKDNSEPCPHCGKVFSTKSSLEPHIEMVHKGVRKACPECGKVLSDLWKHMRTVHGKYRRREKKPKSPRLSDESDRSSEFQQSPDYSLQDEAPLKPQTVDIKQEVKEELLLLKEEFQQELESSHFPQQQQQQQTPPKSNKRKNTPKKIVQQIE